MLDGIVQDKTKLGAVYATHLLCFLLYFNYSVIWQSCWSLHGSYTFSGTAAELSIFRSESICTKFFRLLRNQTSNSLQMNAVTLYCTSQNTYNRKLKFYQRTKMLKPLFLWLTTVPKGKYPENWPVLFLLSPVQPICPSEAERAQPWGP